MCFLTVNLSQTKVSSSNKIVSRTSPDAPNSWEAYKDSSFEKHLMGFRQSAPNYVGLSSKDSVSQKICPE